MGAQVGEAAGAIGGGAAGTVIEPGGGTIVGAGSGAIAGAITGAGAGVAIGHRAAAAVCGSIGALFAKGTSNVQQNRAFQEAVKRIEAELGRRLTADEIERLHREISRQGYTLDEIVEIGIAMFGR